MSRENEQPEMDGSDLSQLASKVLERLRVEADGDDQRELAWSRAVDGIGNSYLEARRLLGFMLEQGWIVRLGRDRVALTRRALRDSQVS